MSNNRVYEYVPQGVCSRLIHIELSENNEIVDAYFVAGCSGNLQGICSLIKGLPVETVIQKLKGIRCGNKATSCPDELASMLENILKKA